MLDYRTLLCLLENEINEKFHSKIKRPEEYSFNMYIYNPLTARIFTIFGQAPRYPPQYPGP